MARQPILKNCRFNDSLCIITIAVSSLSPLSCSMNLVTACPTTAYTGTSTVTTTRFTTQQTSTPLTTQQTTTPLTTAQTTPPLTTEQTTSPLTTEQATTPQTTQEATTPLTTQLLETTSLKTVSLSTTPHISVPPTFSEYTSVILDVLKTQLATTQSTSQTQAVTGWQDTLAVTGLPETTASITETKTSAITTLLETSFVPTGPETNTLSVPILETTPDLVTNQLKETTFQSQTQVSIAHEITSNSVPIVAAFSTAQSLTTLTTAPQSSIETSISTSSVQSRSSSSNHVFSNLSSEAISAHITTEINLSPLGNYETSGSAELLLETTTDSMQTSVEYVSEQMTMDDTTQLPFPQTTKVMPYSK